MRVIYIEIYVVVMQHPWNQCILTLLFGIKQNMWQHEILNKLDITAGVKKSFYDNIIVFWKSKILIEFSERESSLNPYATYITHLWTELFTRPNCVTNLVLKYWCPYLLMFSYITNGPISKESENFVFFVLPTLHVNHHSQKNKCNE